MSELILCLASCFFVVFSFFAGVRLGKKQRFLDGWKACCNEPDYFKELQKRYADSDDHKVPEGVVITNEQWTELYESASGGDD